MFFDWFEIISDLQVKLGSQARALEFSKTIVEDEYLKNFVVKTKTESEFKEFEPRLNLVGSS